MPCQWILNQIFCMFLGHGYGPKARAGLFLNQEELLHIKQRPQTFGIYGSRKNFNGNMEPKLNCQVCFFPLSRVKARRRRQRRKKMKKKKG